jgi:hypothetical protein
MPFGVGRWASIGVVRCRPSGASCTGASRTTADVNQGAFEDACYLLNPVDKVVLDRRLATIFRRTTFSLVSSSLT